MSMPPAIAGSMTLPTLTVRSSHLDRQSGHPLSRHYDDLGVLWRGENIPMTLDPGLARAGAVGITQLVPLGLGD